MSTFKEQKQRAYEQYLNCQDDLAKNTFMESMKEQNQVLYYGVSSRLSLCLRAMAKAVLVLMTVYSCYRSI